MTLDWDDIRYFAAAARGGSTLAASRVLGVSQTTVARRIDRLEQSIAMRLFERHAGGYRLTAAGQEAFDGAQHVEWQVEDFLDLFPAGQRPLAGTLRIVTEAALARVLVIPALDAIRLDLPLMRWEMVLRDPGEGPAATAAELLVGLSPPAPYRGMKVRLLKNAAHGLVPERGSPIDAEFARGPISGCFPRRADLWLTYPERRTPEAVVDRFARALIDRARAVAAQAAATPDRAAARVAIACAA